jgi:hypothetical protein
MDNRFPLLELGTSVGSALLLLADPAVGLRFADPGQNAGNAKAGGNLCPLP